VKILQVHNAYRQAGGEDRVAAAERELLEAHGHEVRFFGADNDEIRGLWSHLVAAWRAPYDPGIRHRLAALLETWRPDVVHVHNFFPLLTPAVFDACRDRGVPSVMTLHNFRLVCPGALLQRKGAICEACLGKTPWRAVLHRCYRNSLPGTLAVARMLAYHRQRHTWDQQVDRFIVMTVFARDKLVASGWNAGKISVKPHFSTKPVGAGAVGARAGALFAGRLSPGKGVLTLLKAWSKINDPLALAGEGPLRGAVEKCGNPRIRLLGWLSPEEMSVQLWQAACLVIPSECYETFGMVVIEAYAHGLPVIASRLGALAELIEDGETGLLFEAGNALDLASKVQWLLERPEEVKRIGDNARRAFAEKYTPECNYPLLLDIYREVTGGT